MELGQISLYVDDSYSAQLFDQIIVHGRGIQIVGSFNSTMRLTTNYPRLTALSNRLNN